MHKSDKCQQLKSVLADFFEGELSEQLCLEFEQHLTACPNCRIVVDTTRKLIFLYQQTSARNVNMPQEVKTRLFHCLDLDNYIEIA